jgi:hypothetical protein
MHLVCARQDKGPEAWKWGIRVGTSCFTAVGVLALAASYVCQNRPVVGVGVRVWWWWGGVLAPARGRMDTFARPETDDKEMMNGAVGEVDTLKCAGVAREGRREAERGRGKES